MLVNIHNLWKEKETTPKNKFLYQISIGTNFTCLKNTNFTQKTKS